jgi:hypothetical protein
VVLNKIDTTRKDYYYYYPYYSYYSYYYSDGEKKRRTRSDIIKSKVKEHWQRFT